MHLEAPLKGNLDFVNWPSATLLVALGEGGQHYAGKQAWMLLAISEGGLGQETKLS